MIVLDTSVVSAVMTGDTSIDRWLDGVRPNELYTTVMTRAEIRFGLARLPQGRRRDDLRARADSLFSEIEERMLPFDQAAADRYGELVAARLEIGRPISTPDAIIASIASVCRATLATRNVRDFESCGLEIVNPYPGSGADPG